MNAQYPEELLKNFLISKEILISNKYKYYGEIFASDLKQFSVFKSKPLYHINPVVSLQFKYSFPRSIILNDFSPGYEYGFSEAILIQLTKPSSNFFLNSICSYFLKKL